MEDENIYRFNVKFLKQSFKFLDSLDLRTREKVLENIRVSRFKNEPKILKKVDKEIWEFRTKFQTKQIRLLAFWDKEEKSLIICTHGFIKKTQKLPLQELKKAKRIRTEYLNRKIK